MDLIAVPFCEEVDALKAAEGNSSIKEEMDVAVCLNCTTDECGTRDISDADYTGNISVSRSGKHCLPWPDQMVKEVPTLGNGPYCRNPGTTFDVDEAADRAFCYVNPDPDEGVP